MGKALRDQSGKFLPGNKLAEGITYTRIGKPHSNGGHFKSVVTDILAGITNEEVLARMRELNPDTFMYIYIKLQEIESDNKLRELKTELEVLKLQPAETTNNDVIYISYVDESDEKDKE